MCGIRYVFAWIIVNQLYNCSTESVPSMVRQVIEELETEMSEEEINFMIEKVLEYKKDRPKSDDDFEERFRFAA